MNETEEKEAELIKEIRCLEHELLSSYRQIGKLKDEIEELKKK